MLVNNRHFVINYYNNICVIYRKGIETLRRLTSDFGSIESRCLPIQSSSTASDNAVMTQRPYVLFRNNVRLPYVCYRKNNIRVRYA